MGSLEVTVLKPALSAAEAAAGVQAPSDTITTALKMSLVVGLAAADHAPAAAALKVVKTSAVVTVPKASWMAAVKHLWHLHQRLEN